MRQSRFRPLFYAKTQRLSHFSRFISFYRNETSKSKNRKTGCKNNQMYLFWTGDSHFVECSFWSWVNKFIPSGIRPVDNNFVTPFQKHRSRASVDGAFLRVGADEEPPRASREKLIGKEAEKAEWGTGGTPCAIGPPSSPSKRAKKGWRNRCHPDFFSIHAGFRAFGSKNRETVLP